MTRPDFPTGLVGVEPARGGAGVRASVGIRSNSGEPILKNRFFLMNPVASPARFQLKSGGDMKGLRSEPHPSFTAWNEEAKKDLRGSSRCGALRANLIHARLSDAAEWNAAAQKLPGHPSPPSQRPACCGDGIRALRFVGMEGGEEVFREIACPNELCEFRQRVGTKPAPCKANATLVFRLRWNRDDPVERDLPEMVCTWHTRSPQSLSRLMTLFEMILGTEKVAPHTPRERWKAGLAADLGVPDPSLVGLPFVMSVGEKSKPSEGWVFPIVSFSLDGDPVQWLLAQQAHRLQLAAGGPAPLALPAVSSPEIRHVADLSRAEWEVVEPVPSGETLADPAAGDVLDSTFPRQEVKAPLDQGAAHSLPRLMQPARINFLRQQAEQIGGSEQRGAEILFQAAMCFHSSGDLGRVLANQESEVLRRMRELAAPETKKGTR